VRIWVSWFVTLSSWIADGRSEGIYRLHLEGSKILNPSPLYVKARSFETFEWPLKIKVVCFFETRGTSIPDIERKSSEDLNLKTYQ
jgi:hypothetical protein